MKIAEMIGNDQFEIKMQSTEGKGECHPDLSSQFYIYDQEISGHASKYHYGT